MGNFSHLWNKGKSLLIVDETLFRRSTGNVSKELIYPSLFQQILNHTHLILKRSLVLLNLYTRNQAEN